MILAHLLRVKPPQISLLLESELPRQITEAFLKMIRERESGVPTAYIIGEWDFWGRTFKLEKGILVPRPETELLVEKTLELIPEDEPTTGFEMGSGSGCISITLLLERPKLKMVANDINPKAIRLTDENALIHGVKDRLTTVHSSMFEGIRGKFDFIVSNPPYIPEREWENLQPEVLHEDPRALIGGEKGWEFHERIAKEAQRYLKKGGFIALEIGHDQGGVVKDLLSGAGFKEVMIYRDYSGQDRVVIAWS